MLPEPDPTLCRALADDLRAADYGSASLRTAWGARADDARARGVREPAQQALGARADALAVLGRLWVLGVGVAVEAAATALPALGVAGAESLGLVTTDGDTVLPAVLIEPQAFADADGEVEWWIASDLDEAVLGGPLPEDDEIFKTPSCLDRHRTT